MSAIEYREYELYCDSGLKHDDPKAAFFKPGNSGKVRVIARARVRQLAAKAGWTHVVSPSGRKYDRDYCPQHNPKYATEAAERARLKEATAEYYGASR